MNQIIPAFLLCLAITLAPASAKAERALRIATDIIPIEALVDAVVKDAHEVDVLIGAQGSPHHFSLRPSEARTLARADIVFHLGERLSPWLGSALQTIAPRARSVELKADVTDVSDALRKDPHTWLDPLNAIAWLNIISEELATADPDNAVNYRINAGRAAKLIEAEVQKVQARSAELSRRQWLVFHDSLAWFSTRFDLEPVGVVTSNEDQPPSASQLAAIRALVQSRDADCILAERGVPSRSIRAIDDTQSLPVFEIDPRGSDLPGGMEHYPALIQSLSQAINRCV